MFINATSRSIRLAPASLLFSGAVVKIQRHRTGATPKTTLKDVVVDSEKGERKVMLGYEAALHEMRDVITLVTGMDPGRIPPLDLLPGESIQLFNTTTQVPKDSFSRVRFSIQPYFLDPAYTPQAREVSMRLACTVHGDAEGRPRVELEGTGPLPAADGTYGPFQRFAFEPGEPGDRVLRLVDAPLKGPCCAIL